MTSDTGHKSVNEVFEDYRTRKEGQPFFEPENNPHYELFCALRDVVPDLERIVRGGRAMVEAFQKLDALPRHDSVLSRDELEGLNVRLNYRRFNALSSLHQRVAHARDILQQAAVLLNNQLRGEDKVIESRVVHQTNEIGQLVESIEAALKKTRSLNRPFEIRQEMMATLVLGVSDLLDAVVPLRKTVKAHGLPEADLKELLALETSFYLHRAAFQKWRDNPSQRLANKLQASVCDLNDQLVRAKGLLRVGLLECRRQGFRRFNRAGEMLTDPELKDWPY